MALYGQARDISLFRHLNREMINKIIDTQVGLYKLSLDDTPEDIYGESDSKRYHMPVKIRCLITRAADTTTQDEVGTDTFTTATFAFLRDDLIDIDVQPEVGDVVIYLNEYYELEGLVENEFARGIDPNTHIENDQDFGWNVSLVFSGHTMRTSRLNIIETRKGDNETSPDILT